MAVRFRPQHEVGYKKPPVHSRFKKGQSGNPRGRPRPRVRRTVPTMLAEALQQTIYITENGKRIKVTKLEVFLKQAVNRAISGDFRSLMFVVNITDKLEHINKVPTKNSHWLDRYKDIDLDKLSTAELIKLQREVLDNTRPLDEY